MADETGTGGGNVFTRKIGPLPMWGWMAIALLVAVFYYLYQKNNSSSGSASTTGTSTAGGTTNSSLIPQFVNQTYVNSAPPAAPSPASPPPATNGNPPPVTNKPLNEILTGGHTISPNPGKAVIGWTIKQQSPNAQQLKVVLNGPGHKNQTRYIPASATTATFDSLSPGHTYVADITPVDAQGQAVGGPNHVTFVTSK